jgi:ferredoxin
VNERLEVDMTRCGGHGICAVIAHGVVELDEWGYPVVDRAPLEGRAHRRAVRAVNACPRQALILRSSEPARLTVTP